MVPILYDRTKEGVNASQLFDELNSNENIVPECVWIRTDGTDSIVLAFDTALSAPEVSEMEIVLANHVAVTPIKMVIDTYQIEGIGGALSEPMGFSPDATRGDKIFSTETFTLTFSENRLMNMDWINIGMASHSDIGYIMPFNGTVIRAVGYTRNCRNETMNIHLFKNLLSVGSIVTLSGSDEQVASAIDLNIDFDRGDKLRLRGVGSGRIDDVVLTLWIKWRKD